MMYYSDEYLCHYGVLGMKWGQHLMAKAKTASASSKAKRAQRKSDIAEGKKYASYSLNRASKAGKVAGGVIGGGMSAGILSTGLKSINAQRIAKAGTLAYTNYYNAFNKWMSSPNRSLTNKPNVSDFTVTVNTIPSSSIALGAAALGIAGAAAGVALATKAANDNYADIGSSARRSANYKTDNMKYKKQVQDAEEKHGVATRIHNV